MTTKRTDHRKHTVDTDKLVERATRIVRELLEDELPEGSSFEEYEEKALEIANEIVRRELQRKLQTIADGFPEQLRIDHNNDWHGWREGTAFDYRKHQPGVGDNSGGRTVCRLRAGPRGCADATRGCAVRPYGGRSCSASESSQEATGQRFESRSFRMGA